MMVWSISILNDFVTMYFGVVIAILAPCNTKGGELQVEFTLLRKKQEDSNIFVFSPLPEEMIQFDEHIFQMGSNHQLVVLLYFIVVPI